LVRTAKQKPARAFLIKERKKRMKLSAEEISVKLSNYPILQNAWIWVYQTLGVPTLKLGRVLGLRPSRPSEVTVTSRVLEGPVVEYLVRNIERLSLDEIQALAWVETK
jgi:hypothetical protein